ncbi:hypothetical protein RUM44_010067 [Polyplax serrata]|uniref:Uncharacterized protein n=1 Tax=Polyplax serrata TaxID=468196 RepID=A0ABR1AUG8_POLSC
MKDYQSPDLIKEITWELVTSQMTKGLEGTNVRQDGTPAGYPNLSMACPWRGPGCLRGEVAKMENSITRINNDWLEKARLNLGGFIVDSSTPRADTNRKHKNLLGVHLPFKSLAWVPELSTRPPVHCTFVRLRFGMTARKKKEPRSKIVYAVA